MIEHAKKISIFKKDFREYLGKSKESIKSVFLYDHLAVIDELIEMDKAITKASHDVFVIREMTQTAE